MRRLAGLLLTAAFSMQAQMVQVTEHTLSNGMKILIHEDHDVPNVALYLFFKVGSRNERPGATGISHFFEHMMFNGAKKYGPKQFDIQMEKAGGRNNAYTSRDVTVYTDWFPRSALELMFDMESDRIRDLSFDPKIVESERGVVSSERRTSVDNNPFGTLYEQLNATAYIAHPYQWPVIGWASDIEAWTMDDLKAHYRMGYAPNNCIVVVSGDVTPADVIPLAKKYLEPIPSQDPPPPVRTVEPAQLGERRVEVHRPANLPLLLLSYHIGSAKDPDFPVYELIETLLTGGRSSRLHQRLVETEQLVLSAGGGVRPSLDPGQFLFTFQVRSGKQPAEVEKSLFEELDRLSKEPVPAEELQKAKNQILADFYRQLKTISGKANLLGSYEVFYGGWGQILQAPAQIEKVTAADIQRVAAKIFSPRNRTVATLIPEQRAEVKQ
jgi:zinc protease